MLWVYDHFKYFYFYSAEIDFSRQNLTSTNDLRAVRIKQACNRISVYIQEYQDKVQHCQAKLRLFFQPSKKLPPETPVRVMHGDLRLYVIRELSREKPSGELSI